MQYRNPVAITQQKYLKPLFISGFFVLYTFRVFQFYIFTSRKR